MDQSNYWSLGPTVPSDSSYCSGLEFYLDANRGGKWEKYIQIVTYLSNSSDWCCRYQLFVYMVVQSIFNTGVYDLDILEVEFSLMGLCGLPNSCRRRISLLPIGRRALRTIFGLGGRTVCLAKVN